MQTFNLDDRWREKQIKRSKFTKNIINMMMMMMMMMVMMMDCFCGTVDQWKVFWLISSQHNCQRPSPSPISDTPQAGLELTQNLVQKSKNLVKTYRPIRLLPIFGNILKEWFSNTCLITFMKMNYRSEVSVCFFTWWFLRFTVTIYCSLYQLFIWLWSYTGCQGRTFGYFQSLW